MTSNLQSDPKVNILGVQVNPVNIGTVIETIDAWIAAHRRHYICVTGVHGVMESQRSEAVRQIHNQAGLVVPDGMPLVWFSRLSGHRRVERVYGPDLMLAVCQHSLNKNYRHYLFGGNTGVPEQLSANLQQKFPGLNICGIHSPPYRPLTALEEARLIDEINQAQADIVWVGLSTPKQEQWMARHIDLLNASVLIGVGAAFDFHAGLKRQAPRWMQRSGLEWFYRLISEPKRLWRRYLINNPLFILAVLAQLLRLKRYPTDQQDDSTG